jgi:hypothetical protein
MPNTTDISVGACRRPIKNKPFDKLHVTIDVKLTLTNNYTQWVIHILFSLNIIKNDTKFKISF